MPEKKKDQDVSPMMQSGQRPPSDDEGQRAVDRGVEHGSQWKDTEGAWTDHRDEVAEDELEGPPTPGPGRGKLKPGGG